MTLAGPDQFVVDVSWCVAKFVVSPELCEERVANCRRKYPKHESSGMQIQKKSGVRRVARGMYKRYPIILKNTLAKSIAFTTNLGRMLFMLIYTMFPLAKTGHFIA